MSTFGTQIVVYVVFSNKRNTYFLEKWLILKLGQRKHETGVSYRINVQKRKPSQRVQKLT